METQPTQIGEKASVKRPNDESQIKTLLDDWVEALKSKDIDRLMAGYSKDLVSFDIMPPLQVKGTETYRKNYEEWFKSCDGPIRCEPKDLEISSSEDLACAFCLNHLAFNTKDGEKMDMWIRWTSILKKTDDRWLITHEHVSVPIDMETDKARWDLNPDSIIKH